MATPAPVSLKSTCHCGAIALTVTRMPEMINECQCTICRRYASAWAYYYSNEIDFQQKGKTKTYVWGDGDLEFHFCETCGCVVYWWRILPGADGIHEVGINSRNMNPMELLLVERRIQYDTLIEPVRDGALKHADDIAKYV